MHLSKGMSTVKSSLNTDYFVWLITFLILTTLILIILIIVILICASYRRKQKLLINSSVYSGDRDIFVVDKGVPTVNGKVDGHFVVNSKDVHQTISKSNNANKKHKCMPCFSSRTDSPVHFAEEGFVLIDGDENVMNIEIRDKDLDEENIVKLSGNLSNGKHEYENGRLSHIDRELPPLPLLATKLDSCENCDLDSSIKESMILSLTGSLKYSDLDRNHHTDNTCNNTSADEGTLSRQQSMSIRGSPVNSVCKYGSATITDIPGAVGCGCSCVKIADVPSADDLSSVDYDPTYAAIRRTKVSCPICGAPSVYTPVNSNRNSNLSLQLNSCLGSPVRCPNVCDQNNDSLNNSTYASIAKLPKLNSNKVANRDQELKSGCSTIKRQRSISQGDIIIGSLIRHNKMQQSEIIGDDSSSSQIDHNDQPLKEVQLPGPLNYMSLWSLMASSRNSPYNMFPIIPERTYGQSVVDLVEKLRSSDDCESFRIVHSATDTNFDRCLTQPLLFGNSFRRRGSLTNFKTKIWTPQSCQMIHGSSISRFGLCSPLKFFNENSRSSGYDLQFPGTADVSNNPIHKFLNGSGKRGFQLFQPVLTPPLSPLNCHEKMKDIATNNVTNDESKYENPSFFDSEYSEETTVKYVGSLYEDLDSECGAVDKEIEVINGRDVDHYEYLADSLQLCPSDFSAEKLLAYSSTNIDKVLQTRARPISIVLYSDDMIRKEKYYNHHRFDNLDIYDVSSVQMSPLMEQSLENSSSKTTLSSLTYPTHFNRLVSSEDSCAKSPPSVDVSPSLDNLEISPDDRNFLFNDFLWSNFNSGFDDYETVE